MAEWTPQQLAAAVDAYRSMQSDSAHGRPFNKAQIYRELAALHGRTPKAWEYRMQNISHVLHQHHLPWLEGLRPAANVGADVAEQLFRLLQGMPLGDSSSPLSAGLRQQLGAENAAAEAALAFTPANIEDQRHKVLATIVRRRGQAQFRSALLQAYGSKCAMTGSSVVDVLEAAHVHPYRGEATNTPSNGLLLRADLHTLFDLYLISVDPATRRVCTAPSLAMTDYEGLTGVRLAQPTREQDAVGTELLQWHRAQCSW